MNRWVAVAILMLGGITQSICAEKADAQKFKTAIWRVPFGTFSNADFSNPTGERKYADGFSLKQEPFNGTYVYDASGYLQSMGAEFPPGSEAFYDQNSGALVVRNTKKNLELIEAVFAPCNIGGCARNLALGLSFYEWSPPAPAPLSSEPWPAYAELQKLPPSEFKLLDEVSVVTKSGVRAVLNHVVNPAPPGTDEPDEEIFRKGESGIRALMEPTLGPDDVTLDTTVTCRFRRPDNPTSEISFTSNFTSWESYPVVIHISPLPGQQGKFLVAVANIQVVNAGGWTLKNAKAAAKKE